MREHGVLDRVLLVYQAVLKRIAANEEVDDLSQFTPGSSAPDDRTGGK
jgi:hypothetical protein